MALSGYDYLVPQYYIIVGDKIVGEINITWFNYENWKSSDGPNPWSYEEHGIMSYYYDPTIINLEDPHNVWVYLTEIKAFAVKNIGQIRYNTQIYPYEFKESYIIIDPKKFPNIVDAVKSSIMKRFKDQWTRRELEEMDRDRSDLLQRQYLERILSLKKLAEIERDEDEQILEKMSEMKLTEEEKILEEMEPEEEMVQRELLEDELSTRKESLPELAEIEWDFESRNLPLILIKNVDDIPHPSKAKYVEGYFYRNGAPVDRNNILEWTWIYVPAHRKYGMIPSDDEMDVGFHKWPHYYTIIFTSTSSMLETINVVIPIIYINEDDVPRPLPPQTLGIEFWGWKYLRELSKGKVLDYEEDPPYPLFDP